MLLKIVLTVLIKDFHSDLIFLFLKVHCTGRQIPEPKEKYLVIEKKWKDLLRDSAKATNWLVLLHLPHHRANRNIVAILKLLLYRFLTLKGSNKYFLVDQTMV